PPTGLDEMSGAATTKAMNAIDRTSATRIADSLHARSKRKTLVLEQPEIFLLVPIEHHAHLPWPREHLRIFDRRFVVDVIGVGKRVPLDDVELVAVKIAGAIKPRLVIEIGHVDHQRV